MRAVRDQVEWVLANGGTLPKWKLRRANGAWTLQQGVEAVRWREADAPGVGEAVDEILQALAAVGPVALAAAKTIKQQRDGRGKAKHSERATAIAMIRHYLAAGNDPADMVTAWSIRFERSEATIYRWIDEARPPP